MFPRLSLNLLPPIGQMRTTGLFNSPDVSLELDGDEPTLTIEEGVVRFDLEFATSDHLAAFLEQLASLKLPGRSAGLEAVPVP